ncbi:hydrogenase maturation nickel metallochaperone HypA [bacterium]|nr:hydrogenase maturation nickel metallochaperone HypA [bacterium]
MHEYTLMENVIETVEQDLAAQGHDTSAGISAISFRIGMLEMHSVESFRQAFDWITKGTILEGAALDFEVIPSRIACEKCGYKADLSMGDADCHDPSPVIACPECGAVTPVQGGRGVTDIQLTLRETADK